MLFAFDQIVYPTNCGVPQMKPQWPVILSVTMSEVLREDSIARPARSP